MLYTKDIITALVYLISILVTANAAPLTDELNLIEAMRVYGAKDVGEFGDYFEGDMLLTRSQEEAILEAKQARNGLIGANRRWPNNTVIFYIESEDFAFSHDFVRVDYRLYRRWRPMSNSGINNDEQVKLIEDGMADIANKSCISFRPRKSEEEHAVIIQGSANGCFSNVGFSSSDDDEEMNQVLNLAKGCFRHGTVVHEMLHTLGFYHMQSTYDRDNYVEIVWENIKPGTEHNFAKYTNDTVTDFGVQYDYASVMHYPETAFSVNGEKTIVPLQENAKIGQRNGLSESDILKLNKMYCEGSY